MQKCRKPVLDPRRPARLLLLTTALGGLAAMPAGVMAQQQHRMMVFQDDSGGEPQVLHFAGPNMGDLSRPDFVRRDLPIFREKLHLDAMQHAIVQVLLDAYLDAFKVLVEQSMPKHPFAPPGMDMNFGPGPDGQPGQDLDAMVREAMENAELSDLDIDADGSGNVAIAVMARAGDGPAGDAAPDALIDEQGEQSTVVWAGDADAPEGEASAGVVIAIGGADDIELPDDVREKLEKLAQDMAERLQARLDEAEANGVDITAPAAGPESMADRRAQLEELRKALEQFKREKEALKQDFLTQVQSQLTAEQLGHWPSFDRALTRVKTLPNGRLDGERTDLLVIADGLDLSEQEAEDVAEPLENYELALDAALRERNEVVEEANAKLDKAIEAGDMNQALSIVDGATRRRVAVRSVNERYTDAIAEKLPADRAAAFRAETLRQSYPRVYRRTRAQKSFKQARALPGLDADVLSGIAAIEDAYEAELAVLNERFRETIRRYQPDESREAIQNMAAMMSGEGGPMHISGPGEDDPIHAVYQKRRDLDERYMKQLYATLAPEQVEQLPPLPSD